MDEVRFNGAEVPHGSDPNVFKDDSGDRIWIEKIPELDMIQVWAYEEEDGERGEVYAVTTVALNLEQTMKLQAFLEQHLKELAAKHRKNQEARR